MASRFALMGVLTPRQLANLAAYAERVGGGLRVTLIDAGVVRAEKVGDPMTFGTFAP